LASFLIENSLAEEITFGYIILFEIGKVLYGESGFGTEKASQYLQKISHLLQQKQDIFASWL
jgi:hypothetical protein